MKELKFNKRLFALRLLVFPCWFTMVFIKAIYDTLALSIMFIIGGGELVALYHDRKTIGDIYHKVAELVDNTKEFGYQKCPACNGTGLDANIRLSSTAIPPCPVCNGKRVMSTIV